MSRCIPCGYDLQGRVAGERCPECGALVPELQLGGAWNDPTVRRRFAVGAWLAVGIAPSALPGVLVSWLTDFHAISTFWMVVAPPIVCALAAVVMLDRGRPQPIASRRPTSGLALIGLIPLLALGCAIASTLDIGRSRDTAGMATLSLMLVFAAVMGVVAGRMRREISVVPSISAALAVVVAACVHLALGFEMILVIDDTQRLILSFGCMLFAAPLALLLAGAAFAGIHMELRRRFGGTA
jgi:hypothetical protein